MVRAHFRNASSTFSPVRALVSRNISSGGAGSLSVPILQLKSSVHACPYLGHCTQVPLPGMRSPYIYEYSPTSSFSTQPPWPQKPSLLTLPKSGDPSGLPRASCPSSDFFLILLSANESASHLYHGTTSFMSSSVVPRLIEHSPKPTSATQRSHDRTSH